MPKGVEKEVGMLISQYPTIFLTSIKWSPKEVVLSVR